VGQGYGGDEHGRPRHRHRAVALKKRGQSGGNADWQGYLPLFRKAQKRLERKHRRQRIDLMMWHKQREEILKELGADLHVD
jgi:preprotein translocase subunit SecA